MPDDALAGVLRLVSEGRLTADEAAPILDALDRAGRAKATARTLGSESLPGMAAPPPPAPPRPVHPGEPRFARVDLLRRVYRLLLRRLRTRL